MKLFHRVVLNSDIPFSQFTMWAVLQFVYYNNLWSRAQCDPNIVVMWGNSKVVDNEDWWWQGLLWGDGVGATEMLQSNGSVDALFTLAYRWHLDLLNDSDIINDESKVKLEGDVRVQFDSGSSIRGHS